MNLYLFAAVNAVLAAVVMGVCLCRQSASSAAVLLRVRWAYSLLGASYLAVAVAPLYGEWPGWSNIAGSVGTLALLFSGSRRWKRGAPEDVLTQPAPLGEH